MVLKNIYVKISFHLIVPLKILKRLLQESCDLFNICLHRVTPTKSYSISMQMQILDEKKRLFHNYSKPIPSYTLKMWKSQKYLNSMHPNISGEISHRMSHHLKRITKIE